MVSNYLGIPICMHCTDQGYDLYDQTLQPITPRDSVKEPLHILWCRLSDEAAVPNHLAPILYCSESKTGRHIFSFTYSRLRLQLLYITVLTVCVWVFLSFFPKHLTHSIGI